jgi:hypothetical protein
MAVINSMNVTISKLEFQRLKAGYGLGRYISSVINKKDDDLNINISKPDKKIISELNK